MIRPLAQRPPALPALVWVYAALLLVWGNAQSVLLEPTATLPGGSWAYGLAGAALGAVSLATARAIGLDAVTMGLRGSAARGTAIGALAGLVTSVAGVAALRLAAPAIVGEPIDYEPLATVSATALLWHVAVLMPLGVAIPEEMAFRGVLLGALARQHGTRTAIAASAAAFAAWHGSILLSAIADTTLAATSPWVPIATVNALAVLAAGGAIFAWLRLATGSLAATVAAHWTFNVVVLVGLWATRPGCC
ncbi:MAG: CPBP family intramembrane glutamic endopeptidase [Chloroflexota bacterium]